MTPLRQRMLEELQRRNYSPKVMCVKFCNFGSNDPEKLSLTFGSRRGCGSCGKRGAFSKGCGKARERLSIVGQIP